MLRQFSVPLNFLFFYFFFCTTHFSTSVRGSGESDRLQVFVNRLCFLSSTCSSLFGFQRLQEDGAITKALLLKVCHRVGSQPTPSIHSYVGFVLPPEVKWYGPHRSTPAKHTVSHDIGEHYYFILLFFFVGTWELTTILLESSLVGNITVVDVWTSSVRAKKQQKKT